MGLLTLLNPVGGLVKAQAGASQGNLPERTAKSWTVDPYTFIESLTHRDRPSSLSYDQLRMMSMKCDAVAAILFTRIAQVASFSEPQVDRHSTGFVIVQRDGKQAGSKAADAMIAQLTQDIQHCGMPGTAADTFENFLKKIVRDTLVYDQVAVEVIPRNNGKPAFFEAVDASTIRFAAEPPEQTDQKGFKVTDLNPQTPFQQVMAAYNRDLLVQTKQGEVPAKYVQMIGGVARATYTEDELWFGVRNPRTDINIQGYGMSELEVLINIVTSYLFAEDYNKKMFTQGSSPKGILNLKGEIADEQLAAFKREWRTLISGERNSWLTPVINAEDVEYIGMGNTNKDMEYMQWIQFLIRIASACYLIDPAEINFDMPRGLDQSNPMIESGNEGKLRASRDRGLRPLLRFIQRAINECYIYRVAPDFEFRFAGLDAKTVEQEQANITAAVSTYKTLNEVRATEDLPPLPGGDIPLNPAFIQALQLEQAAEQHQAEMQMQAQELAVQAQAAKQAAKKPPAKNAA